MSKRRLSLGMGTPLADVGLVPTAERRVSLGRSPEGDAFDYNTEEPEGVRRHTIGHEFSHKLLEGEQMSGIKRASYSEVEKVAPFSFSLKGQALRDRRSSGMGIAGGRPSWNDLDENDENVNNVNTAPSARESRRFSLMPLDTYEEDSREYLSKDTTRDSGASTASAAALAASTGVRARLTAVEALDEKSLFSALSAAADSSSKTRRGSLLSQISAVGLDIDEDPRESTGRLSIAEVLRSFRDDPTATENAFAMVTATGKLLPTDFRKFVRAFKSPTFKAKGAARDSEGRSSTGGAGGAVGATRHGQGLGEQDANPSARLAGMFDQADTRTRKPSIDRPSSKRVGHGRMSTHGGRVVASVSTAGAGRPAAKTADNEEEEEEVEEEEEESEAPWTEQELRRASEVLQLANDSMLSAQSLSGTGSGPAAEASLYPNLKLPSPDTSLEQSQYQYQYQYQYQEQDQEQDQEQEQTVMEAEQSTSVLLQSQRRSALEVLQAELHVLRAEMSAKEKQTAVLSKKLQLSVQSGALSEVRSAQPQPQPLRSTAQAAETLRSLEVTRLAYEMDIARRSINRMGLVKYRIQERRDARQRRLQQIDEMDEQMSLHVERRDSGVYEREPLHMYASSSFQPKQPAAQKAGLGSASELPSPGPYRFGGLPRPANPDALLGSAFLRPLPKRSGGPQYPVSSSSSSSSSAAARGNTYYTGGNNHAYANDDDYAGGGDDYGGYADNAYDDHAPTSSAMHAGGAGKRTAAPAPKAAQAKRAPAVRREPRPVFKASPNTRFANIAGMRFIPLQSPEGAASRRAGEERERSADYEDLLDLDAEYRREKRLAAALQRREARRTRDMPGGGAFDDDEEAEAEAENNQEEEEEESERDDDEDYRRRRLHTFKSLKEKRRVGRPRGTLAASTASAMRKAALLGKGKDKGKGKVPGRGRGRPRKNAVVPRVNRPGSGSGSDSDSDSGVEVVRREQPAKRGRGRPRKVVQADSDGSVTAAADAEKAKKKEKVPGRRGRPPKAEAALAAARAGNAILSAKEIRKLERKAKRRRIADATSSSSSSSTAKPRLVSPYGVFCKHCRPAVVEAQPEHERSPQEILRLLAARWRQCGAEERQRWQGEADEENARNAADAAAAQAQERATSFNVDADGDASLSGSSSGSDSDSDREDSAAASADEGGDEHAAVSVEGRAAGTADTGTGTGTAAAALGEKRKRGRPRKNAAKTAGGGGDASGEGAQPAVEKRKRGRPKKATAQDASTAPAAETGGMEAGDSNIDREGADADATAAPAEKRRRGRPRKNVPSLPVVSAHSGAGGAHEAGGSKGRAAGDGEDSEAELQKQQRLAGTAPPSFPPVDVPPMPIVTAAQVDHSSDDEQEKQEQEQEEEDAPVADEHRYMDTDVAVSPAEAVSRGGVRAERAAEAASTLLRSEDDGKEEEQEQEDAQDDAARVTVAAMATAGAEEEEKEEEEAEAEQPNMKAKGKKGKKKQKRSRREIAAAAASREQGP